MRGWLDELERFGQIQKPIPKTRCSEGILSIAFITSVDGVESGIDGAVGDIGSRLANSIGMPTPDIAIIKVGDDDEIPFGHEEASLLDIA